MIRSTIAGLALSGLVLAASAAASPKPCRDASGKIIACPKPKAQPQGRCKDERGKFVKCGSPNARPAAGN